MSEEKCANTAGTRFVECKTGYSNLDEKSGGLYSGLYVLAGMPGIGKTTFAYQMADQIAEAGGHVIFVSFEQTKMTLKHKSLVRIIAKADPQSKITRLSLLRGEHRWEEGGAATTYKNKVGKRLFFLPGCICNTVSELQMDIENYIGRMGIKPVVIVDNLQALLVEDAPYTKAVHGTAGDEIHAIKQMSCDLDLPVVVVSGVNWGSYFQPIDFKSLIGRGEIEYVADVIWGLQLQCVNEECPGNQSKRGQIREAMNATPRKIELVCLKNRYGMEYSCRFGYFPAQETFVSEVKPE